jgi:hypothetical protein
MATDAKKFIIKLQRASGEGTVNEKIFIHALSLLH